MQAADDRARGEISKFFRSNVVSLSAEEEKYKQIGDGKEAQIQHDFDIKVYTRVRAEAKLEGIEFADRTVIDGTYYSLAVLDKPAAIRKLASRISDLDLEIEQLLKTPADPVEKRIKALARVLHLMGKRAGLNSQLEILGVRAAPLMRSFSEVAVELRDLLLAHAPVVVTSASDDLAGLVADAVLAAGLVVVPASAAAATPLAITGDLVLDEGLGPELFQVGYQVHLSASWMDQVVAQTEQAERVQHTSLQSAKLKAIYEVRDRAVTAFVKEIQQYLLGDFEKEEIGQ